MFVPGESGRRVLADLLSLAPQLSYLSPLDERLEFPMYTTNDKAQCIRTGSVMMHRPRDNSQ
jgi:hypothetical protein